MNLKNKRLLAAFFLGAMFVVFSALTLSAQSLQGNVIEGDRFEDIEIGKTTMDEVASIYGKDYEFVTHKQYSYEMVYKNLGLSFTACQDDPKKEIFVVEFEAPFKAITSKGIVLGESTLGDVFRLYESEGKKLFSDSDQKGVFFFVEDAGDSNQPYKPAVFKDAELADLHKTKVIKRIKLVEATGLRQCFSKFPKNKNK